MKSFKNFRNEPQRKKVYRYSNYLQSKDNDWVTRNIQSRELRRQYNEDIREPIEEDIRD